MNRKKTLLFLLITMAVFACGHGNSQQWQDLNHGVGCGFPRQISDFCFAEEGQLFIRGDFNHNHECEELWNISQWSDHHWIALSCNDGIGSGHGITNYNNKIYTTGNRPCMSGDGMSFLLGYNDSEWEETIIDSTGNFFASDLIVLNEVLYIAGSHGPILNSEYAIAFFFDGQIIQPLVKSAALADEVNFGNALAFYHDTLYIGGKFNSIDKNARVDNIATVYDTILHKVGTGLFVGTSIVEALCVHRDTLFIGGLFYPDSLIGNTELSTLLYYADGKLGDYGIYDTNRITCMRSYNNELYLGGWFQQLNGITCHGVAKLNGHHIFPLNTTQFFTDDGTITQSNIRDMEIFNDTLYIAGGFNKIGEVTDYGGIAKLKTALSESYTLPRQNSASILQNPSKNPLIDLSLVTEQQISIQIYDPVGRIIGDYRGYFQGGHQAFYLPNYSSQGTYIIEIKYADNTRDILRWMNQVD